MNATQNFSDFSLDSVLQKISETEKVATKNSRVEIEIMLNTDDRDALNEYKRVLVFLKQKRIINRIKDAGEIGYVKDPDLPGPEVDMYFYMPTFILNRDNFEKFLLET